MPPPFWLEKLSLPCSGSLGGCALWYAEPETISRRASTTGTCIAKGKAYSWKSLRRRIPGAQQWVAAPRKLKLPPHRFARFPCHIWSLNRFIAGCTMIKGFISNRR